MFSKIRINAYLKYHVAWIVRIPKIPLITPSNGDGSSTSHNAPTIGGISMQPRGAIWAHFTEEQQSLLCMIYQPRQTSSVERNKNFIIIIIIENLRHLYTCIYYECIRVYIYSFHKVDLTYGMYVYLWLPVRHKGNVFHMHSQTDRQTQTRSHTDDSIILCLTIERIDIACMYFVRILSLLIQHPLSHLFSSFFFCIVWRSVCENQMECSE